MTESSDSPPPLGPNTPPSDTGSLGDSAFDTPHGDSAFAAPHGDSAFNPTPPPPVRRFRRSDSGTFGGVATGMANYFSIDPLLAKIIMFALMVMSGGALFFAYLAAWLMVPSEHDSDPRPFAITTSVGPLVFGTLLMIAVLSIWISDSGPGGSLVVPSLLVAGGVFLLNQQSGGQPADSFTARARSATPFTNHPIPGPQPTAQAPAPPTPVQPAPPAPSTPSAYGWATPHLDADPVPSAPPEPVVPKPPITAVTLAVAAVAIGVLALVDQFGANIGARAYAGLALAIIGIGLMVSSVIGRAWRLIPLGLVAMGVMLVGPIADGAVAGGVGPKEVTVTSEEDLQSAYSVGVGYYELDLSGLTLTEDRTVRVEVGAGYAEIRLPSDANVRVEAQSNFGYVDLFGREVAGVANSSTAGFSTDEGPTLTLIAETEFGYVEVSR